MDYPDYSRYYFWKGTVLFTLLNLIFQHAEHGKLIIYLDCIPVDILKQGQVKLDLAAQQETTID